MSRETAAAPVDQPPKLDKEFVGGIAWTAAAKWISQLVSWPSVIIATRFLSQSDFGTVDMAGFYYTLTNVLAEFGIGTAVLQLRELEDKVIAQMNTVSVLFGTLATGLSLLVAPLIADFFKAPILTLIIRIASGSFLIVGLQAVPMALMQRAMDYRRLSISGSAAQATVQALVTVGGAVTGMGVMVDCYRRDGRALCLAGVDALLGSLPSCVAAVENDPSSDAVRDRDRGPADGVDVLLAIGCHCSGTIDGAVSSGRLSACDQFSDRASGQDRYAA